MPLCETLRQLRKQNKMTLEDVAGYLQVGRATILKYENGIITNIPSDKIEQLARLFNVSPAFLMGWSDDTPADQPDIRIVSGMMEKMSKEQQEQVVLAVREFSRFGD